jgi:hypothetical protein
MLAVTRPAATTVSDISPMLYWVVQPGLDVYANTGELTAPWRLGNLATDGLAAIVDRFMSCSTPGLHAMYRVSVCDLARRYGRPDSRRIYPPDQLRLLWVTRHARDAYAGAPATRL